MAVNVYKYFFIKAIHYSVSEIESYKFKQDPLRTMQGDTN